MKLNHSIHGSTDEPMLTRKPESGTDHHLCRTLFSALAPAIAKIFPTRHLPQEPAQVASFRESDDKECARFPDQCPTTTELGKGIP